MKVGVLVISSDEGELLRHALPTALDQDVADVLVLDNGSRDSTAQVAEELGVRTVRLDERQPWPRAMNVAREMSLDRHLDRLEAVFAADLETYAHSAGR